MAKNYSDLKEEERKERVLQVADYIIKEKASTRKVSKYFSKNNFPISNATVYDYVHNRLPKIDLERYQKVMEILKENLPKTLDEIEVKIRVLRASSLSLQGFTVSEIAEILQSTVDTIYNDLTIRLPKIDQIIGEEIAKRLTTNRLSNLTQYAKKVSPELIEEYSQPSQRGK